MLDQELNIMLVFAHLGLVTACISGQNTSHTHTSHTHPPPPHTHTHTHVCFCELWGLSIDFNNFYCDQSICSIP